jgi:hypothetical protein
MHRKKLEGWNFLKRGHLEDEDDKMDLREVGC